jgi:hypothetical protein
MHGGALVSVRLLHILFEPAVHSTCSPRGSTCSPRGSSGLRIRLHASGARVPRNTTHHESFPDIVQQKHTCTRACRAKHQPLQVCPAAYDAQRQTPTSARMSLHNWHTALQRSNIKNIPLHRWRAEPQAPHTTRHDSPFYDSLDISFAAPHSTHM